MIKAAILQFFDVDKQPTDLVVDNLSVTVQYEFASQLLKDDLLYLWKAESEGFKLTYWLDDVEVYQTFSGYSYRIVKRTWDILPDIDGEEKFMLTIELDWEETIE